MFESPWTLKMFTVLLLFRIIWQRKWFVNLFSFCPSQLGTYVFLEYDYSFKVRRFIFILVRRNFTATLRVSLVTVQFRSQNFHDRSFLLSRLYTDGTWEKQALSEERFVLYVLRDCERKMLYFRPEFFFFAICNV